MNEPFPTGSTAPEIALAESAARYRRLIELLPVAVAVHCDGEIVFVNPAAVALMRATEAAQLVGTSIFDIMPPAAREQVIERIRRAHGSGDDLSPTEQQFLTLDGTTIDTEVKAIPMRYGDRAAMMVIVHDVTALKRAEDERRKLEQQVRHVQKLESLGVLAGGIAHDFNNILMAVLGNLDLALLDLDPRSPVREYLADAQSETLRAADLSRQMLAYSGRSVIDVAPTSLNRIIEETTSMLEACVSKKALLSFDLRPDLPLVDADAAQLRQVLVNLVANASEAIGDRAGAIAVRTGVEPCDRERLARSWLDDGLPAGDYVRLTVADSGSGMDAETRARVFDPFFSTKFTGRGLGLATVLGIVRGHRGAIELESAPDDGTRFTVLLPVSTRAPASATAPALAAPARATRRIVLLVDDEEGVRAVAGQMIERLGYEVVVAADGVAALAAVDALEAGGRAGALACVVLDLKMPRMDGEEALRELKRRRPSLPVILSSGYGEEDVSARFAGADLLGFLQKPYVMKRLAALLRRTE